MGTARRKFVAKLRYRHTLHTERMYISVPDVLCEREKESA